MHRRKVCNIRQLKIVGDAVFRLIRETRIQREHGVINVNTFIVVCKRKDILVEMICMDVAYKDVQRLVFANRWEPPLYQSKISVAVRVSIMNPLWWDYQHFSVFAAKSVALSPIKLLLSHKIPLFFSYHFSKAFSIQIYGKGRGTGKAKSSRVGHSGALIALF